MSRHSSVPSNLMLAACFGALMALTACGKAGTVTVQSAAFPTSGEAMAASNSAAVSSATSVTDFKFCLKKVRLENEKGEVEQKDGEDEIDFRPGLIDASSGKAIAWGQMEVPTGFKLSKLKIKVGKDQNLCGTPYSVNFNGQTTPQDVEFRWKFDPAIELKDGDTLTLALDSVVSSLLQASDAGTISSMKQRIEEIEGKGRRN